MKKIFILFFVFIIVSLQAQVTVNQYPEVGTFFTLDEIQYDEIDFVKQVRTTGGDQKWNFAGINKQPFEDTIFFLAPKDLTLAQPVAGSNFLVYDPTSLFGEIFSPYTYYSVTSTEQKIVGLYLEDDKTIKFDKSFLTNIFPLDVNEDFEDVTTFNVILDGIGQVRVEVESFNTVDGWGEISTGNGKYQCLRVKSTYTLQGALLGLPLFNSTVIDYRWLAPGLDYDVFKYSVIETEFGPELENDTLSYSLREQRKLAVNDFDNKKISLQVNPNPTTDEVTIQLNGENITRHYIEIYDGKSSIVYKSNFDGNTHSINVNEWNRGAYMVKVSNSNNQWDLQKLILQ
ncbi:MAG: T9SS type A sorting domain-containing protein [Saprospiraceae bacterium]|nr:T9SS type A sorting domain-containing protein [Saprospiraceae bacterium]